MINSVSIIKLTPPQLDALHRALPGLTGAGVLTSTSSIATFEVPAGMTFRRKIGPDWLPTVETITRLVASCVARARDGATMFQPGDERKLITVLAKLTDPEAKHLRLTGAAL